MKHRRFIKKLSKHKFVAKDPNLGTEFFLKSNDYSDLSVLVFDPSGKTIREFIVDAPSLVAIYQFTEGKPIDPLNGTVEKGDLPYYVKLLSKGSVIMTARQNKFYGTVLLANTGAFGDNETSLTLRRVAYSPRNDNFLIGVDTLALSEQVANLLMQAVYKKFNKNDIMLDFGGEVNED